MDTIWNSLIEYESRDLVQRAYQKRHGRSLSASAIQEITSSFIQAREYYLNASRSAITVRPLLQYYGVVALTRGLVLVLTRGLSASALKPSHGLDTKNWKETLAKGLSALGSLEVIIREGTFNDLLKATDNSSYFKANSNRINWRVPYDLPETGQTFTLEDIVSVLQDVSKEYSVWKGTDFISVKMEEVKVTENNYEVAICKRSEPKHIEKVFPPDLCGQPSITTDGKKLKLVIPKSFIPYFSQMSDSILGIGDVYIVPRLSESLYLNTISLYFSASFILGMLARYFPATWISLGRVEKGDAIFPLVNHLLDTIQFKFPQIVLDFLRGPYKFENKIRSEKNAT